ncbi:hypothetical protein M422DRAFT_35719 [Sphaerobolus stellatus SS14]|uniref:Uncharacterized protein n=1 Tax=Sphaerobolus stellatus (strain SS14) TaxID=990650 RepID=A0A0C9V5R1_SPHS4|nr:hypothetical protein M422DRAFT_35719 [Sphaerobolus stellatus SS14]
MPPRAKKPASPTKTPATRAKPASKAKQGKHDDNGAPASKKKKAKQDDADDDVVDDDDDVDTNMVTVVRRGAAPPVDPHSGYVGTHQVYEGNGGTSW